MKTFALLISGFVTALLVSNSAQAIEHAPGSFVPSQCGVQEFEGNTDLDVREVCFGQVTGEIGAANIAGVAFRMNDGTERVFSIAQTANLFVALLEGKTKSMFYLVGQNGEQHTMKVIKDKAGHIQSVSGTLEGINYLVSEFEAVFTIQGF